jgi:hypothetical protein
MNHQNPPSNSSNNNMKTQHLIEALNKLPDNLALTPVSNKAPKIKNWQKPAIDDCLFYGLKPPLKYLPHPGSPQ